jgi:hypothetical protein
VLILFDFLKFVLKIKGLEVAVGEYDFIEFFFVESPHLFKLVCEVLCKLLANF